MPNKLYSENCQHRQLQSGKTDSAFRSPYRRDYARLIHSPAFRRLQGKTQLYPGHESDFFRNRLTHSLEVAQIAKSIAQKLNHDNEFLRTNPIDCDLVEFAALAHDLGHPPFGHNGEHALDDCMKRWGGFEGNAQTLRILAVSEKKETTDGGLDGVTLKGEDNRIGLNLTFRSLAAILKYDNEIPVSRKNADKLVKGYYCTEKPLVSQIREVVASDYPAHFPLKTVECQIMDIADDIAYSTYDLEDGLKGGFVNPLMLLSIARTDTELLQRVTDKVKKECPDAKSEDVLKAIAYTFRRDINGKTEQQPEDEQKIVSPLDEYILSRLIASNGYSRAALTSSLVDSFINSISISIDHDRPALSKVTMDPRVKIQVESLKHLNYEVTIMSPRLKLVEYRGYEIVKTIFRALSEDDGYLLLPQDVRESHQRLQKSADKMRLICDFVSGMTDRYAIEFFGRLKQGDQSIFKPF
ncbi:Deoxyguanosinetriphosphate triphosphohydrolase-like protein [Ferriphaselus amnicola]|uniref:Deoxyguanosinetriphosphate triphosphohydrolase-like protein n=1 Tax=Ferriphaselus amnicola TaxID=1188319 RepID=A0A2Z6GFN3_9PROT|nr:dNTP triphosphohydrolase [Ferriphaselus amnicola]BBE51955.1 Deoxyguanosinetriphosphate triphosphohydrolase-like protein [Ferriphaselus amnicola]